MIKAVLIGCGAISQEWHVPALSHFVAQGELEVVGLFEPDASCLAQVAKLFPAASHVSRLEDIAGLKADLAIIASPPGFHASQSITCLKAGMAVLCEKPMAHSVAEGRTMVEAARSSSRPLAIGLVRRHFAATQTIQGIVANQTLGRLCSFTVREGGRMRWPMRSPAMFMKEKTGGGVLMDTGVHTLDLILWWCGRPVSFDYQDDAFGGLEDNCKLVMRYADYEGTVQLSRDQDLPNGFFLQFERGWIHYAPYVSDTFKMGFSGVDGLVNADLEAGRLCGAQPAVYGKVAPYHYAFIEQLRDLIEAVATGRSPKVTAADALASMEMIAACYAQRKPLPMTWMSEEEQQALGRLTQSQS